MNTVLYEVIGDTAYWIMDSKSRKIFSVRRRALEAHYARWIGNRAKMTVNLFWPNLTRYQLAVVKDSFFLTFQIEASWGTRTEH